MEGLEETMCTMESEGLGDVSQHPFPEQAQAQWRPGGWQADGPLGRQVARKWRKQRSGDGRLYLLRQKHFLCGPEQVRASSPSLGMQQKQWEESPPGKVFLRAKPIFIFHVYHLFLPAQRPTPGFVDLLAFQMHAQ